MSCWAGQLPPPPSTASRSDKEAKHGPNQKRKISRKIQTKSKNQIGTLHAISFGGHVNPKRTVGDVLENFVGAPAHSLRNLQIEDIIKGEALGPYYEGIREKKTQLWAKIDGFWTRITPKRRLLGVAQ